MTIDIIDIADLGWTKEEAAEIRASLISFEPGWNVPEMEAYDDINEEVVIA